MAFTRSRQLLKDFRTFALRANAIDLAIGVTIGAAFNGLVSTLVSGLFTPLIAAIFGQPNFAKLTFTIHHSQFAYGAVINAVISLLIVLSTMFFFVVKPLSSLRRALGFEPAEPVQKAPCPACLTEIPRAATRCAFCTEQLVPDWASQ
jgi:large conductance mechanosensitive channel